MILSHVKKVGMVACMVAVVLGGCATRQSNPTLQAKSDGPVAVAETTGSYNENELVDSISTHLGVTSESAASLIERMFRERGRPVGYITGEEAGGAVAFGLKYGKGTLWMKDGSAQQIFWQGPTVGWDLGADASKVFVLVYGLDDPNYIYQRFPGVDGSAYLVAGMAVNYQRANGITLAPVRSGVGARLGANVGYTNYSRKRRIFPL